MSILWQSSHWRNVENLALRPDEKLCIVAQTTFNYNKFQDLVEKISENVL